jgi:hypothetical protein
MIDGFGSRACRIFGRLRGDDLRHQADQGEAAGGGRAAIGVVVVNGKSDTATTAAGSVAGKGRAGEYTRRRQRD